MSADVQVVQVTWEVTHRFTAPVSVPSALLRDGDLESVVEDFLPSLEGDEQGSYVACMERRVMDADVVGGGSLGS